MQAINGVCLLQPAQVRHLKCLAALADVDGDRALFLNRHARLGRLRDDDADRHIRVEGLGDGHAQMLILQYLTRERHLFARHVGNGDLDRAPELSKAEENPCKKAQNEHEYQPENEFPRAEE